MTYCTIACSPFSYFDYVNMFAFLIQSHIKRMPAEELKVDPYKMKRNPVEITESSGFSTFAGRRKFSPNLTTNSASKRSTQKPSQTNNDSMRAQAGKILNTAPVNSSENAVEPCGACTFLNDSTRASCEICGFLNVY